jgi:hypothetical protein
MIGCANKEHQSEAKEFLEIAGDLERKDADRQQADSMIGRRARISADGAEDAAGSVRLRNCLDVFLA